MNWEGDQQSSHWNAAFTKSLVLARTWTTEYLEEMNDRPLKKKRDPKTSGKEVPMQGDDRVIGGRR